MDPLYMTDLEALGVIWILMVISWVFIEIIGGLKVGTRLSGTKYQTDKPSALLPVPKINNEKERSFEERNYICLRLDPANTINKLEPDNPIWNMEKVREGLRSGMLRYASKQEVAEAIRNGLVKS
jgi:hypothetical protein